MMHCHLKTCTKPARMVLVVETHPSGTRLFRVWPATQVTILPAKAVAYCKEHGEAAVTSMTDLIIEYDVEPRPAGDNWTQPVLQLEQM